MWRVIAIWLCCFPILTASDLTGRINKEEYQQIITKVVGKTPADREIMFVGMLFQVPADVRHRDDAMAGLIRLLERTSKRKFEKDFTVDYKYGQWMLENLREMRTYNQAKEADILRFAEDMDEAGLKIGDSLKQINKRHLLFLIRYLSSAPPRDLIERNGRRGVTTIQLLVVMQAEQNKRNRLEAGRG